MECAVCKSPIDQSRSACIACGAAASPSPPAPAKPKFVPGSVDAYAPGSAPTPGAFSPQPPVAQPVYAPPPLSGPAIGPVAITPAAAPIVKRKIDYVAVGSFVCGLLGLIPFWIGFALCLVAIALGVGALWRSPKGASKVLAIVGLVLGLAFVIPAGCGL